MTTNASPPRSAAHDGDTGLEPLADRLHSVAIHLLRRVRVEDAHTGLNPARLSALSVVVYAGPIRLGELARAEQVRPPTMTQIVRAMELDGLVERLPDEQDGRATRIAVTSKGRRLFDAARRRRLRRLAQELGSLRVEDRRTVEQAAAALAELFLSHRHAPDP